MHKAPNSSKRNCNSLPAAAPTDRDIGDYTEAMLRALERLAQVHQHEVLAELLHLASAEAKNIKTRSNPR